MRTYPGSPMKTTPVSCAEFCTVIVEVLAFRIPIPEMPSCRPPAVIVKFDVLTSSVFVDAKPPPGLSPMKIAFVVRIEFPRVQVTDPAVLPSNATVPVNSNPPPVPQFPPQNVIVLEVELVNAIGAAKDQLADVERFAHEPLTVHEPEVGDVM